jgi:predicted AlkP superfamily pyrophosphatase or phosphodiesterase
MRRVVVVVLDGLSRDLITEAHMPALSRFADRRSSPSTAPCSCRLGVTCLAVGTSPY